MSLAGIAGGRGRLRDSGKGSGCKVVLHRLNCQTRVCSGVMYEGRSHWKKWLEHEGKWLSLSLKEKPIARGGQAQCHHTYCVRTLQEQICLIGCSKLLMYSKSTFESEVLSVRSKRVSICS